MRDPACAAFSALDPFFDIVRQGLAGLVDGDHYFDTIAPDAVFEFRYRFPGWPTKLVGREALMALYAGYGEGMALHGADALVVNISQTPGVVILEYEVQGNAVEATWRVNNQKPKFALYFNRIWQRECQSIHLEE